MFLTKFDSKTERNKEHLVSGYLSDVLKNQQRLPHDRREHMTGNRPLTLADVLDVNEEENKIILI